MKLKMIKSAIAMSVLLASASAFSSPITNWYFETSLTFNNGVTQSPGIDINQPGELAWGDDNGAYKVFEDGEWINAGTESDGGGRSALTIGDPEQDPGIIETQVTGNVLTGGFAEGNTMTHWNNPISDQPYLLSGSLIDNLKLWEADGDGNAVGDMIKEDTLNIDFSFLETPNRNTGDQCNGFAGADNPDDPGSIYAHCPDLWAVSNDPFSNPTQFTHDGWVYQVNVIVLRDGIPVDITDELLEIAECQDVFDDTDYATKCVGFRTAEEFVTTIGFGLAPTVVGAVPLPAAAWLFGSALLGFVGYNRRKNRKT